MKKDNTKRRKAKDNPYTIFFCKETGKYFLSFKDGLGEHHRFEIDKSLYDVFDGFELDDLSILNEFDNHAEHSELTETSLNKRAFHKPESVEKIVCERLRNEQLHNAISELPDTQRRRLTLYYFGGLTLEQIAKIENCSVHSVFVAVERAKENIKKFIEPV